MSNRKLLPLTYADDSFLETISRFEAQNLRKTRNSECFTLWQDSDTFYEVPLVTLKKTAWKTALKEMEWFLSGNPTCPEGILRDKWWKGQLDEQHRYINGYPTQLRNSTFFDSKGEFQSFDQIKYLLESLRNHPYSRRHVISAWNSGEMANITQENNNPMVPTTCHMTLLQCFVSNDKKLSMVVYNRSQDILLGMPHNWIQHWALGLYLAHFSNLTFDSLTEIQGDLHIYNEPSHIACVDALLDHLLPSDQRASISLKMEYSPKLGEDDLGTPKFRADDFTIIGDIPEPIENFKIKRL
jgi:thymidylate synthase